MNKSVIVSVIIMLSSCFQEETAQRPTKELSIAPGCAVSVTRGETDVALRFSGTTSGAGKITSVVGLNSGANDTWNFEVGDKFNFEITHSIPKTERMIPMTFMFTGKPVSQYVCRLSFTHLDGSKLTDEELDGVKRTNTAVNGRSK